MTPDTHSHNVTPLSAQLLQDYVQNKLNATDRMRVKRLLSESELAATAAAGFAAVPEALNDIASLQAEIAARSGMSGGSVPASKNWLNWLAAGAGVASVVVLSLLLLSKNEVEPTQKSTSPQVAETPAKTSVPEQAPQLQLNPVTDHFVNPKAKPSSIAANTVTANQSPATVAEPQPIAATEPTPTPPSENVPAPVVVGETKINEPNYNFPIRYVLDLKVTEYDRLYKKPLKVRKLRMTGTPASLDQPADRNSSNEEEVIITADKVLLEGLEAFRAQRYGKSISQFETLLKNSPDDVNAQFYMAVSYVKLEMYAKAIPFLDAVIASQNNAFREEAQWYKALALIGMGDSVEAENLLKKIAAENTFYSKQAAAKLKDL